MADYSAFEPFQAVDNHARDEAIRLVFARYGPAHPHQLFERACASLARHYHTCRDGHNWVIDPEAPANCGPLLRGGLDIYLHIMSFLLIGEAYKVTSRLSKNVRMRALPSICANNEGGVRAVTHVLSPEKLLSAPFLRAGHIEWNYFDRIPLPAWTTKLTMTTFKFIYGLKHNLFRDMEHVREIELQHYSYDDIGWQVEPNMYAAALPPRLETLDMGASDFNLELVEGFLPSTLRVLILSTTFNQTLHPRVLPDSLQVLMFETYTAYIAPNVLPPSLTELNFGCLYNHPLHRVVGNTVEFVLPRGLKILKFYDGFNQELVPGALPPELHTLGLDGFSQVLAHPLPATLKSLDLLRYPHVIGPNILPKGLRRLLLRSSPPLPFKDIPNLEEFIYRGDCYDLLAANDLPKSLQRVQLHSTVNNGEPLNIRAIPETVTSLEFSGEFDQEIHPGDLPRSLTKLVISSWYTHIFEANALPLGLIEFEIGGVYNQEFVPHSLPCTLEILDMSQCSRYSKSFAPEVLPPSLTTLAVHYTRADDEYDTPIFEANVLPKNIQSLTITGEFPQEFDCERILPDSLHTLRFGVDYRGIVYPQFIPPNIRELNIGMGEFYSDEFALPDTLQKLVVSQQVANEMGDFLLPYNVSTI
jgi:hypothetical protein